MKCYLVDRHLTTTRGMLSFLQDQGDEVIDRSFTSHWQWHYAKAPNREWKKMPRVYNAAVYAQWADRVAAEEPKYKPDFYFCALPPALFTLFEKSAAPTLCNMGHRLEHGLSVIEPRQFDILIEKAIAGMESGKLLMYSMSQYDIAYFKYFTGKDVSYFPPPVNYLRGLQWQMDNAARSDILLFCGKTSPQNIPGWQKHVRRPMNECLRWFEANSDIKLTANPIFPSRNIYRKIAERPMIAKFFWAAIAGFRPANAVHPRAYFSPYIQRMRHALGGFSYRDLTRFKAIVMFPYSTFSGVMLELIEMGVPMFYPSKRLLKRWDERYGMMFHRTNAFGERRAGGFSNVAYGKGSMPDPNDSVNREALHYWLEKAEFYNWDVRYFDSPADLHEQLKQADFEAMHRDVLKTRARMDKIRDERWAEIRRDLTKTA